ncbi:hypothetical protein LCGC14_2161600 [marine sediment metagenome]|uniref:Uncharacterized protein n=1 Tax=marine sediment metagenome TaxID=412755 RepID=A0A0F9DSJ6_9ZZZZ
MCETDMEEKIQYSDKNAYDLLNRLLRLYPFSIQTNERLLLL